MVDKSNKDIFIKKKVYLNMDNTLVDFDGQIFKYNFWIGKKCFEINWKKVKAKGHSFWSEMNWEYEAEAVFNQLMKMNDDGYIDLYIISLNYFDECCEGKKQWVATHTSLPIEKLIFVNENQEKAKYGEENAILIDHSITTLRLFSEAGGYPIYCRDLKPICRKIELLTNGCSVKSSRILNQFQEKNIKYEIIECILDDGLRITEIRNNKELFSEIVVLQISYFYDYYNEVAKYFKDNKAKTVIACIQDLSGKDPNDIFCGNPYSNYQRLVNDAKYIDMSEHIWENSSYEELVYSCLSTLIGGTLSEERTSLYNLRKDLRKDNLTNIHFLADSGNSIMDLIQQFEEHLQWHSFEGRELKDEISINKIILCILSSNQLDVNEIKKFQEKVIEKLDHPVCVYTLLIDESVCKNVSYHLIFQADEEYSFYAF